MMHRGVRPEHRERIELKKFPLRTPRSAVKKPSLPPRPRGGLGEPCRTTSTVDEDA